VSGLTSASFERTRFAPAPTGLLHLGHVANAVWTWGVARAVGAEVLLRIEDHDRQRCRRAFDAALLQDLEWLGFIADAGPVRQSDADALAAYEAACQRLRRDGLVYGCECSRSTFAAWARDNGHPWAGAGCPSSCRDRRLDGPLLRVAVGDGRESWADLAAGACESDVAPSGDLPIRDRHGNWTYGFCVVVDDARHGIDLVVRGEDLLTATANQLRLARILGRETPPTFLHHLLIRRPDGSKLSKSAGDTGVRELRAAGHTAAQILGSASELTGFGLGSAGSREHREIGGSHTG
jgi:glutamyl/glutaminyl-tRNA synthetase